MTDFLAELSEAERAKVRDAGIPRQVAPMLATLVHDPFSDPDWIYERKLDGVRCLVWRDGRGVRLRSRGQEDLGEAFPELEPAVEEATTHRVVADGEIVAFRGQVTSFAQLQRRIGLTDPDEARREETPVHLYLFDLLHIDGHDLTGLPLRTRKRLLRRAFTWEDPLRFTPHRNEDGAAWLEEACEKGWEGLIAKRADAPYVQRRSRDWLKFKCTAGQELVIGGFTEPAGSRGGFGALLVGYHEDGALRYAGRVGTGFDDDLLASLRSKLERIERKTSPFDDEVEHPDGVHWVTPRLVAEVGFTEWTDAGRLRHPRFLGLRTDKEAADVVREPRQRARDA